MAKSSKISLKEISKEIAECIIDIQEEMKEYNRISKTDITEDYAAYVQGRLDSLLEMENFLYGLEERIS